MDTKRLTAYLNKAFEEKTEVYIGLTQVVELLEVHTQEEVLEIEATCKSLDGFSCRDWPGDEDHMFTFKKQDKELLDFAKEFFSNKKVEEPEVQEEQPVEASADEESPY